MGVAYNFENMERLVAAVGLSTAKLMLYTAKRFDAAQAHTMGLIDEVATDDVGRASLELAQTIARNAPLALRAARFSAEQMLLPPGQRDSVTMAARYRECLESADHREGRTAFLEKRTPVFVGA
jgi:enoyl-CoA hydratase/carnithine racemase